MNKTALLASILSLTTCFSSFSVPKKGTNAPDVEFTDQKGETTKISDFLGQRLALVFLPSTSGWSVNCKAQACSLKVGLDELVDYDINLICTSADSTEKLVEFIKKNDLTFPLFHANKKAIKAYDVDGWLGLQRYTFLIDENGIIVKVITKVDLDNHAQQIIDGFNAAQ